MRTCAACGCVENEDDDPVASLAWSVAVERGQRCTYCPACARRHVRSMEGRLDPEHW